MSHSHKKPVLGHIHVPKTGGFSFRRLLGDCYGPAHVDLYFANSTTFVYEEHALAALVGCQSVRAFSSHFVRRFPAVLANRPIYYVTFLREPASQFISYVAYTRKYYRAIQDTVLLSHLPPDMPDLSIRECARWILSGSDTTFRNFRENYTTNFFARYPLFDAHRFEYADRAYRAARLSTAQHILGRFLLVGITEQMDESYRVLRRSAAEIGMELPNAAVPFENVTGGLDESLTWIREDDEVGARMLNSLREDTLLYRWALKRLREAQPTFVGFATLAAHSI